MSEVMNKNNVVAPLSADRPVVMPGQKVVPTGGKAIVMPKPYRHRAVDEVARESGYAGSVPLYLIACVGIFLLNIITLGLIYPILYVWKRGYIIDNTYIGGRNLVFYGEAKEIYGKLVLMNYLSILTLGLMGSSKRMMVEKWVAENTEYLDTTDQDYIGESTFTGNAKEYFVLKLKGFLATIFTLGFMYPVFKLKAYKYIIGHTYINGSRLELDVTTGKFYKLAVLMSVLTVCTIVGAFATSIANKKYLYKYIVDTKELYAKDSIVDAGLGYDDVMAFNDPHMDIEEYTNAVASLNAKDVDEVRPLVNARVNWARNNADKFDEHEKIYKKDRPKFAKIGSASLCLALVFFVLIAAITVPAFGIYYNVEKNLGMQTTSGDVPLDYEKYILNRDVNNEGYDDSNHALRLFLNDTSNIRAELNVPDSILLKPVKIVDLTVTDTDDRLSSVKLGRNVEILEATNLTALKDIELNDGLKIMEISNCALTDIKTPSTLVKAVIYDMDSVTNIELNEGILSVDLNNLPNVKSVKLPSTVQAVKLGYMPNLESIVLGDEVKVVDVKNVGIKELILPKSTDHLNILKCNNLNTLSINSKMSYININETFNIHTITASADSDCRIRGNEFDYGRSSFVYINSSEADGLDVTNSKDAFEILKLARDTKRFRVMDVTISGNGLLDDRTYTEVVDGELVAYVDRDNDIEWHKGEVEIFNQEQKKNIVDRHNAKATELMNDINNVIAQCEADIANGTFNDSSLEINKYYMVLTYTSEEHYNIIEDILCDMLAEYRS